jgi:hypothetical protein
MESTSHPNVHEPWRQWSDGETLHVASAYCNPVRWQSRRELMNDFRQHMAASKNVKLYAGEIQYGERPFEVTSASNPLDLQLRTRDELWHKENLLNLVTQRFPADWKYGAVIDADFHMTRPDWALEAIHQLQLHDFVQLFSSYAPLSADHRPTSISPGFAYTFLTTRKAPSANLPSHVGAPGGAWAFRRDAFNQVGGLLDTCILGSADWHMATALVGIADRHWEMRQCGDPYVRKINAWAQRAGAIKGNISYIENHAIHHFHGAMSKRGYGTRGHILLNHQFDPDLDLKRDSQGLWAFTGNKPGLRDDIRSYFRERNEDSPELGPRDRLLV